MKINNMEMKSCYYVVALATIHKWIFFKVPRKRVKITRGKSRKISAECVKPIKSSTVKPPESLMRVK